jgi:hypothetical protein
MKLPRLCAATVAVLLMASPVLAADDYSAPINQKDAIKGTMHIDFGTRTNVGTEARPRRRARPMSTRLISR